MKAFTQPENVDDKEHALVDFQHHRGLCHALNNLVKEVFHKYLYKTLPFTKIIVVWALSAIKKIKLSAWAKSCRPSLVKPPRTRFVYLYRTLYGYVNINLNISTCILYLFLFFLNKFITKFKFVYSIFVTDCKFRFILSEINI